MQINFNFTIVEKLKKKCRPASAVRRPRPGFMYTRQ